MPNGRVHKQHPKAKVFFPYQDDCTIATGVLNYFKRADNQKTVNIFDLA
jgi:hypothetical protein